MSRAQTGLAGLGAALIVALLAWIRPAQASDHLTGIVLMAPAAGTVVIHHAPFDGMPAMTMTFRISGHVALAPGDRISADVDRSAQPWSLGAIRVLGNETAVPHPVEPAFLQTGDAVPGGTFIDEHGHPFSLHLLRGKTFALTFMYTRCNDPTMCPLVSAKFRSLQRRLSGSAALVEISLDPAYDRPPELSRYAARFGADTARWHLLTGDPRRVLDFAARFGILEHSAGPVTIVHSERLAIVNGHGRIEKFFANAAWSPDDVRAALTSPDAPRARTAGAASDSR